jgi:hypothetical protein
MLLILIVIGYQKKTEVTISLSPSPTICSTHTFIECVYDSVGSRYIDIDTIQKSFQSGNGNDTGKGLPVFSKRTGQILKWKLMPETEYTLQTFTTDSSGNFRFHQAVDYPVIRDLFARGARNNFHNVPFQLVHRDSLVSSVTEEYIP